MQSSWMDIVNAKSWQEAQEKIIKIPNEKTAGGSGGGKG